MAQTKDLRAALLILDPHDEGSFEVGHDIIFLPGPEIDDMAPIDISMLGMIGVFWSSDYDCWCMYA